MKGTKNSLKVKWNVLNNNGSIISEYILETKTPDENDFVELYRGSDTNYNVLYYIYSIKDLNQVEYMNFV